MMKTLSNWKFWQRPVVTPLSLEVRGRLVAERGLSHQAAASLRMIEHHGNYSGRKVTYFRVFDPEAVNRAGVTIRHFSDLDGHRLLQLHTGHVESGADGTVVGHIVLSQQQ